MPKHYDRSTKHQAGKLHNARGGAHQRLGIADRVVDPAVTSTPGGFGLSKLAVGLYVARKHGQPECFAAHQSLPKRRSQIEFGNRGPVFNYENPKNSREGENT